MKTNDLYKAVAETFESILMELKANPEKWVKPWIMSDNNGLMGHNAVTKHEYTGINQLMLTNRCYRYNYPLNRWITYKQASELNAQVRKGEKATEIVYMSIYFTDKNSKYYTIEEANKLSREERKERGLTKKMMLKYYNVFNVAQVENLPEALTAEEKKEEKPAFQIIADAEKIMEASKAVIQIYRINRAFYAPGYDKITLPLREQFTTNYGFYETAFHELGHWTGHPERLNRKLFNMFGTEDYAREELTAEMCSVFTCANIGIQYDMRNSARYVDSWLGRLWADQKAFVNAILQAQTAANYLMNKSEVNQPAEA